MLNENCLARRVNGEITNANVNSKRNDKVLLRICFQKQIKKKIEI